MGETSNAGSAFARLRPDTLLNVQRPIARASILLCPRRRRFVDCADNGAHNYHFDQAAYAPINDQLPWERLHRIKAHTHADRCDFQQDTKADPSNHAATGETARVNPYKRK